MENVKRNSSLKLIAGILLAVFSFWGLLGNFGVFGGGIGVDAILLFFVNLIYYGAMIFLAVLCFLPQASRLLFAIGFCAVGGGAFINAIAFNGGSFDIYLMLIAAFFAVTLFLNEKLPVKKLSLIYALAPVLLFLIKIFEAAGNAFSGSVYSMLCIRYSLLTLALSALGAVIVSYNAYDKASLNNLGKKFGIILFVAGLGCTLLFTLIGLVFGSSLFVTGKLWLKGTALSILWLLGALAALGGVGLIPLAFMYPGNK